VKSAYITGVAGLLGSNIARFLLQKGFDVRGCDNLSGGYVDNIPLNDFDKIDILDTKTLIRYMGEVDLVINCAALPYEGVSVFSPALITQNIYSGTISTATAAIANNVKHFIQLSSMARYGGITPPFNEWDNPKPQDPYGMAKLHAEEALELLSKIHNFKYTVVVPHNVIGRGQVYTDPYRNVAAIFANRYLLGKGVFIYGDGQQIRSFSHVDDCVRAIYNIILSNDSIPNGEIFNIGPDNNEITIELLAKLVATICEVDPLYEFLPDRPQEVKYAYCSSEKAKAQLGYTITKTTEEAVRDVVSWAKERGPREFNYHLDIEIKRKDTPKTWIEELM
jgi:UDP-glucose 4-epimerase